MSVQYMSIDSNHNKAMKNTIDKEHDDVITMETFDKR